jgi:gluconolactonase
VTDASWTFAALTERFDGALDGPAWDGGGVLFCCPSRNEIQRWDAATGACSRVRHPTVRIRGLAFDRRGRLFAAQARARRVVWLSAEGGTYYLNAMLDGQRHNDPQDLVVDGRGRIWFTDRYTDDSIPGPVGYPPLGHQSVLRLAERDRADNPGPDDSGLGEWSLERVTFDTVAPGGIALALDDATLYVVDAIDGLGLVKAYPLAGDELGAPRVLHRCDDGERAGGACIDADGNVVVAVAHGDDGHLAVVDPQVGLAAVVDVPEPPTNVCTGGPDGRTLFVTTASGLLLAATP